MMNKKLPLLLCAAIFPLSAHAALIGRYKMDAASGSQADSSGVSPAANAFPSGANFLYQQAGPPAGSYGSISLPAGTIPFSAGFSGALPAASTDHWLVSTDPSPTVTAPARYNALLNNFTVMGWMNPSVAKTQRLFSSAVSSTTLNSWGFGMTSALKMRFTDYGLYDADSTPSPIVLNTWQHIAISKSSTAGLRFYHNGNLVYTDATRTANIAPGTTLTSATNWRLLHGPNNEMFQGLAAEVRLYDNVLTDTEIRVAAGHLPTPSGNMTSDFNPPTNPFLNFSHGTKASATAASIAVFPSNFNNTANKPAVRFAEGTDDFWVGKAPSNAGSVPFPSAGGVLTDWIGGSLYHAWSGGRAGYLTSRYAVPAAGFYDINAVWKSHTQAGCKAQVSVVLNGTSLFDAPIDGYNGSAASITAAFGPAQTASCVRPGYSLAAGDTLDFITSPDPASTAGNLWIDVRVLPVAGPPVSTSTLVISEFVASNTRSLADEDGRNGDWIEIYNGTGATVDLTNWSVSDNATQPRKWVFPAGRSLAHGQFIVIFADNRDADKRPFYTATSNLHTNFQLSGGGEFLGLFNPSSQPVSQFTPAFPAQATDIAYGLAGSVGPAIGYLVPTPGRVNGSVASAAPATVTFSVPSGVFTSAQSVNLVPSATGQTIRYTLNNTEPTLSNGNTFTAGTPLNVTTTTIVRARAFIDGIGGPIAEATYLFTAAGVQPSAADTYRLPIIVIDTLAGGTLGGFGGEAPQKAAMVAVFEPGANGQTSLAAAPTVLSRGASHVRGQSSAGYNKQGFDLEFWDEIGGDRSVPLLGMPADGDWALYAPYEFDRVYMNNVLAYEMAARTGRYAARTRFVELYVNTDGGTLGAADYYGIYVLTETVERGPDRVDVASLSPSDNSLPNVTGGYIVSINKSNEAETVLASSLPFMRNMRQNNASIILTGGMTTFLDYPELSAVTPTQVAWIDNYLKLTEESIYGANYTHPVTGLPYTDYIARDNWIDFHLGMTIPMCIDALRLSTFFYKERNGKLKCGPVWDFDRGFNSRDSRSSNPNAWETTNLDKTEYFHYGWWHKLFLNPDFMQAWIDRYAFLRSTGQAFDYTGVIVPLIDGYAQQLSPTGSTVSAQTRDYTRWAQGVGTGGAGLSSARTAYPTEVTNFKTWINSRFNFIDGQILKTPAPSVPAGVVAAGTSISFTLTGASASAQIYVTTDGSDPRLPGGTLNPAATLVPNGGSITVNNTRLVRFRQRDTTVPAFNSDTTTTKMSAWSALGERYYIVGAVPAAAGMITVSTLHYHPADPTPAEITAGFTDSDQFEYLELQNISAQRVNLQGCRFSAGFDYTFPVAALVELAPGERVILAKNLAAFTSRGGAPAAARVIGEFGGNDNLNNAGETVTLLSNSGANILSFDYDDVPFWPVEADGLGPALVLIAPETNPNLSDPFSWRLSTAVSGSPVTGDRLTYTAWKTANGIASDTADGDADGLLPFMEYALGSSTTAPSLASLPVIAIQPNGSLLITITRALNADDAAWEVQSSDTLGTWSTLPATLTGRQFDAGTETLILTAPAPAPGQTRRYVRIRFSQR